MECYKEGTSLYIIQGQIDTTYNLENGSNTLRRKEYITQYINEGRGTVERYIHPKEKGNNSSRAYNQLL